MYLESIFCFPRIVSNVFDIRGGGELVTLVGVSRQVHLFLPRKCFVLVNERILGYVKP